MDRIITVNVTRTPAIDLRLDIFEISTPNTPVDSEVIPAANIGSATVTFTNLQPVTHILRLYEYAGGVLGSMIQDWVLYPKTSTIQTPEDIELTCGVGPGFLIQQGSDTFDGSTLYPQHQGKVVNEDYRVIQRGFGPVGALEVVDLPPFGFQLTGGVTFQETWFIQFIPKLIEVPPSPVFGRSFVDILEVTGNTLLSSTYYNSIIDVNSSTNKIKLSLDFLASVPDNTSFKIVQDRGNQINCVLEAKPTELIIFNGEELNSIPLMHFTGATVVKKGNRWRIIDGADNNKTLGKVFASYSKQDDEIILQGQLVNRDEYVALTEYALSLTTGKGVIDDASWLSDPKTYRSMFSLGDGVSTLRLPDLRGLSVRFLDLNRGIDVGRLAALLQDAPGSYQDDNVKAHDHTTTFRRDNNVVSFGGGNGVVVSTPAGSSGTFNTGATGSDENTMKNLGLLPLMKF